MGAALLTAHLPTYVAGGMVPQPQPVEGATAAARVRVEEAFIDPTRHRAEAVLRAIRAFDPKPGAWTEFEGVRVKLWRARAATGPTINLQPFSGSIPQGGAGG